MELPSDYWSGLLPLAALHLLVRPLSGNGPLLSLGLPRWLEDALLFLQLRLSRDHVERHFVFSEATRRDGRAYTLVTHMLLHESHAHLAANLEACSSRRARRTTAAGPRSCCSCTLAAARSPRPTARACSACSSSTAGRPSPPARPRRRRPRGAPAAAARARAARRHGATSSSSSRASARPRRAVERPNGARVAPLVGPHAGQRRRVGGALGLMRSTCWRRGEAADELGAPRDRRAASRAARCSRAASTSPRSRATSIGRRGACAGPRLGRRPWAGVRPGPGLERYTAPTTLATSPARSSARPPVGRALAAERARCPPAPGRGAAAWGAIGGEASGPAASDQTPDSAPVSGFSRVPACAAAHPRKEPARKSGPGRCTTSRSRDLSPHPRRAVVTPVRSGSHPPPCLQKRRVAGIHGRKRRGRPPVSAGRYW